MADLSGLGGSGSAPTLPKYVTGGSGGGGGGGESILKRVAMAPVRIPLAALKTPVAKGLLYALDTPRSLVNASIGAAVGHPEKFISTAFTRRTSLLDNPAFFKDKTAYEQWKVDTFGPGVAGSISHAAASLIVDGLADPLSWTSGGVGAGAGVVDDLGRVRRLGTGVEEALNLAGTEAPAILRASLARKGVVKTVEEMPDLFKTHVGDLTLRVGQHAVPGSEEAAKLLLAPTKAKEPILEALTRTTVNKNEEQVIRQVGLGQKKPRIQQAAKAVLDAAEEGKITKFHDASAKFLVEVASTHEKSLSTAAAHVWNKLDETLNEIVGSKVARDFGKDQADGGASELRKAFEDVQRFTRNLGMQAQRPTEDILLKQQRLAEARAMVADGAAVAKTRKLTRAEAISMRQGRELVDQLSKEVAGSWSVAGFREAVKDPTTAHDIAFATIDAYRKGMEAAGMADSVIIDSLVHGDVAVLARLDDGSIGLVGKNGDISSTGGLFNNVKTKLSSFSSPEKTVHLKSVLGTSTEGLLGNAPLTAVDRILSGRHSIVGQAVRGAFDDSIKDLASRSVLARPAMHEALDKAGLVVDAQPLKDAGQLLEITRDKVFSSLEDRDSVLKRVQAISEEGRLAKVELHTAADRAARLEAAVKNNLRYLSEHPVLGVDVVPEEAMLAKHSALQVERDIAQAELTAIRAKRSAIADDLKLAHADLNDAKKAAKAASGDFANARASAAKAWEDLPEKVRRRHPQGKTLPEITKTLEDQTDIDMMWTERALGFLSAEFVQQGKLGLIDRETAAYVGSLLVNEDNIGKVMGRVAGITAYIRSALLLSPSFHSRNMLGAVINNTFYGVRLKDYRAFTKMYYADPETWTPAFRSLVELMPSADRRLATHQAAMGLESSAYDPRIMRMIHAASAWLEKFSPARQAVIGRFDWGQDILQVETAVRGALYMKLTEQQGRVPASAWATVSKVHVDYSDVSATDVWMRRVIPFYMYSSRNLPLQLEMMARGGNFGSRLESFRSRQETDQLPPFGTNDYLNLGNGFSFNLGGLNPATNLFGDRPGVTDPASGLLRQAAEGLHPVIGNTLALAQGNKRGQAYGPVNYIGDLFPMYRNFQALAPGVVPESAPSVLRPVKNVDRLNALPNAASVIFLGGPIRRFNN